MKHFCIGWDVRILHDWWRVERRGMWADADRVDHRPGRRSPGSRWGMYESCPPLPEPGQAVGVAIELIGRSLPRCLVLQRGHRLRTMGGFILGWIFVGLALLMLGRAFLLRRRDRALMARLVAVAARVTDQGIILRFRGSSQDARTPITLGLYQVRGGWHDA